MEIADTTQVGEIITTKPVVFEGAVLKDADGKPVMQTETKCADMIEHRKLRIDTRLKLLAKWNPKKYGDKMAHTGPDGGDLVIRTVMVQPAEKRETDRPPLTPEFGE